MRHSGYRRGAGGALLVPVEVARRLLLEPQAVVLRGLLGELGRLLEHVLALGRDLAGGARGGPPPRGAAPRAGPGGPVRGGGRRPVGGGPPPAPGLPRGGGP